MIKVSVDTNEQSRYLAEVVPSPRDRIVARKVACIYGTRSILDDI